MILIQRLVHSTRNNIIQKTNIDYQKNLKKIITYKMIENMLDLFPNYEVTLDMIVEALKISQN